MMWPWNAALAINSTSNLPTVPCSCVSSYFLFSALVGVGNRRTALGWGDPEKTRHSSRSILWLGYTDKIAPKNQ